MHVALYLASSLQYTTLPIVGTLATAGSFSSVIACAGRIVLCGCKYEAGERTRWEISGRVHFHWALIV